MFVRHLRYFLDTAGSAVDSSANRTLRSLLRANAASVWANQNKCGLFANDWTSANSGSDGSIGQQIAALDALNADSDYIGSPSPCGDCRGRQCVGGRCVCACSQTGQQCADTVTFASQFGDACGVSIMSTAQQSHARTVDRSLTPRDDSIASTSLVWLSFEQGYVTSSPNLTDTEIFVVQLQAGSQTQVRLKTTEKVARYVQPVCASGIAGDLPSKTDNHVSELAHCDIRLVPNLSDAGVWTVVEVDQAASMYALQTSPTSGGAADGYLRVDDTGVSIQHGSVFGLQFQRMQRCIAKLCVA